MFRQVSFDGELNTTKLTSEFPFSLVVCSLLVVLQGRLVAEDGRAERTRDDLPGMCRSNVTIETGATRELRIAFVTLEVFLAGVRLHMAGQRLPVLELLSTLAARERFARCPVQVLVDGEVVLAREGLWTMITTVLEFGVGLVRPLMTL